MTPKKSQTERLDWLRDQLWRKLFPWELANADKLRRALVDLGYYAERARNDDPLAEGETANHRGALHTITDELSADDLNAVFQVARLLLLTPDRVDVHALAAEHDKYFLDWYERNYGKSGRKGQRR